MSISHWYRKLAFFQISLNNVGAATPTLLFANDCREWMKLLKGSTVAPSAVGQLGGTYSESLRLPLWLSSDPRAIRWKLPRLRLTNQYGSFCVTVCAICHDRGTPITSSHVSEDQQSGCSFFHTTIAGICAIEWRLTLSEASRQEYYSAGNQPREKGTLRPGSPQRSCPTCVQSSSC